jgi:hypothetical protein
LQTRRFNALEASTYNGYQGAEKLEADIAKYEAILLGRVAS